MSIGGRNFCCPVKSKKKMRVLLDCDQVISILQALLVSWAERMGTNSPPCSPLSQHICAKQVCKAREGIGP